jgi:hypothetical protein
MLHLLSKPPVPDVGQAPCAVSSTRHAPAPGLISEQEVLFATAAATLVPPATTRRHRLSAALFATIRRIHIALPEPRPTYPRREAGYFEGARLSRQMDHL